MFEDFRKVDLNARCCIEIDFEQSDALVLDCLPQLLVVDFEADQKSRLTLCCAHTLQLFSGEATHFDEIDFVIADGTGTRGCAGLLRSLMELLRLDCSERMGGKARNEAAIGIQITNGGDKFH